MAFTHEVTGTSSLLYIPVRAGRRTIGALAFGFTDEGSPGDGLVSVAETLAELTGQALERAQRYEAEHATAHQLQQALPAARLVLYTDGLVERRGRSIDDGFGRLARVVGELPAGDTASACDRLLILMTHGDALSDDIAIICIDLNGPAARPLPPDANHR